MTGTRNRTGEPVPLRNFLWDKATRTWHMDTQYLNRRLDSGDPAAVDEVISAMKSRRHGRLASDGTVWHLTAGVDVSVSVMSFILDAMREAGRPCIGVDAIKVIVSQLGSRIGKLRELAPEQQQHARAALYKEIVGALC